MRKILLFLAICLMTCAMYAVPQAFRYQAVIRDNTGAVVANTEMHVRVRIFHGGMVVNAQDHTTRSNAFGMINLEIGRGAHHEGVPFEDITTWGDGSHYVQLEINIGGGSGHVNMGAVELLSVPFALFALNAANADAGGGGGTIELNLNNRVIPFFDGGIDADTLANSNLSQIGNNIVVSGGDIVIGSGGTLQIGDYIFPATAAGAAEGQVLTLDADGVTLVWADAGGGSDDWERSPGPDAYTPGLHLRNLNEGNVFIGTDDFSTTTDPATRLYVAGDIELKNNFRISVPQTPTTFFTIGMGHSLWNSIDNASVIGGGNTLFGTPSPNNEFVHISGHHNEVHNSDDVFVFGGRNHVTGTPNVSVLGAGNRINLGMAANLSSILIGNTNILNTVNPVNNILIGQDNTSTRPNAIALGSGLQPSQSSIFIGRDLAHDPSQTACSLNIVMGYNVNMFPIRSDILSARESILIGNNIVSPNPDPADPDDTRYFSANRTIAIGNDIFPHSVPSGVASALGGAESSINIGNEITAGLLRAINIGENITAVAPLSGSVPQQTIAIGRDITFPHEAFSHMTEDPPYSDNWVPVYRSFNNQGAIVIGTNFPGRYPWALGTSGQANILIGVGPGATIAGTTAPRPRFVVGGRTTWQQDFFGASFPGTTPWPDGANQGGNTGGQTSTDHGSIQMTSPPEVHFIYIDDFANVYFGFHGSGIRNIVRAPRANPSAQVDSRVTTHTGGTIFARQLVALAATVTPSDRYLKTNIVSLRNRNQPTGPSRVSAFDANLDETGFAETLFAQALSSINVYAYNYDFAEADPREQWGFMAQDVLEHFPHAVQSIDGETLAMSYERLIPVLWMINQDQQTQIEQQQARIIELEKQLARILELLGE